MAEIFATENAAGEPIAFTIVRGTKWNTDNVQVLDSDDEPVDLTGITDLWMRVRAKTGDTDHLLELSKTNGKLVMVNASEGIFGIRCTTADTLSLPQNDNQKARYVFDVIIEREPDEYEAALSSLLFVLPQVTRPNEAT